MPRPERTRPDSGHSPSMRGRSAAAAHPQLKLRGKSRWDAQKLLHGALHRAPTVRARLWVLQASGTANVDSMMDTVAGQRARIRSAQVDAVLARLAGGVATRAIQRYPLLRTQRQSIRRSTSASDLGSLHTSAPPSQSLWYPSQNSSPAPAMNTHGSEHESGRSTACART